MPPKKQGEGAEARYNAKKPTVSFRVYDTGMKDAIYAQAKRKGLSVSAYLSDLVAADLDGKKPKTTKKKAQRPRAKPGPSQDPPYLKEMDSDMQELMDALDEMHKADRRRSVF